MADTMDVTGPESPRSDSLTVQLTTPDYDTLRDLMEKIETDLSPVNGPYSNLMRPEGCLVNLCFAMDYIETHIMNDVDSGCLHLLLGYVMGKYGKSAVDAVKARYTRAVLEKHHSYYSWDIEDWYVARHLAELALKDLHYQGDRDTAALKEVHYESDRESEISLLYIMKKLSGWRFEFDSRPATRNPLTRTDFRDDPTRYSSPSEDNSSEYPRDESEQD